MKRLAVDLRPWLVVVGLLIIAFAVYSALYSLQPSMLLLKRRWSHIQVLQFQSTWGSQRYRRRAFALVETLGNPLKNLDLGFLLEFPKVSSEINANCLLDNALVYQRSHSWSIFAQDYRLRNHLWLNRWNSNAVSVRIEVGEGWL